MDAKPADGGADERSASRRSVDVCVAAIALLAGAAVMFDSYRLGAGWANDSPQSGYFPFRIGAIICIASVVIIVRALLAREDAPRVFVRWKEFRLVIAVLAPTLAYVAGMQLVGIYVASALFVGGFMRLGGHYGWLKTLAVSVGTALVLFWLFEIEFMVPLPKGPLEALLGY